MNSIKDVVRSSMKVPEFDKRLKIYIGRNVGEMTIKMKIMIKILKCYFDLLAILVSVDNVRKMVLTVDGSVV